MPMMNLKIIREDDRYLWCLCSNHNDVRTPNLCINKTEINGKPKGYGYCYACGYRIDIPPEEVDAMSKKKTICRKIVLIDWKKLNYDYQMQTFINGKFRELEQQWNVHCLFKYGIGWDGESHTFCMRREDGVIIGIQRRLPCGGKLCVPGSQLGLFLPNMQITQPVVIAEGLSDAAVATELGYWGLGKPSASFGDDIILKFLTIHKVNKAIIVADNDEIGRVKSEELQEKLLTSGVGCVIIYIEKYKDLRKYYLNEGKEQTVKLLGG